MSEKIRLDKFISSQKGVSRSDAKKIIKSGEVSVNGIPVKLADLSVDVDKDSVTVNGERIGYKKYIYIMLNKPKGVVSASRSPEDKTVIDLLPEKLKRRGLFPAGRLDKDSTGFVLITDDGDFAHSVLSPSRHVPKTYVVTAEAPLSNEAEKAFFEGVNLSDGVTKPASVKRLQDSNEGLPVYEVILTEGRYHQIKRMFSALGSSVFELHRSSFGGLELDKGLAPGECREINQNELLKIRQM